MILHTINGTYPDQHFAWTISAEDVGAAAQGHVHEQASISGLVAALSEKIGLAHTHDGYVRTLTFDGVAVTGSVAITLSGMSAAIDGSAVSITLVQSPVGPVIGLRSANPARNSRVLRFNTASLAVTNDDQHLQFLAEASR